MIVGSQRLRSLRALGSNSEFYFGLLRHMDDYHQAAGDEQMTSVQQVIFIIRNFLIENPKPILLASPVFKNRYWSEPRCSVHNFSC